MAATKQPGRTLLSLSEAGKVFLVRGEWNLPFINQGGQRVPERRSRRPSRQRVRWLYAAQGREEALAGLAQTSFSYLPYALRQVLRATDAG